MTALAIKFQNPPKRLLCVNYGKKGAEWKCKGDGLSWHSTFFEKFVILLGYLAGFFNEGMKLN